MIPVDQIDYAIVRFRYREITDASAQEKSPALWTGPFSWVNRITA